MSKKINKYKDIATYTLLAILISWIGWILPRFINNELISTVAFIMGGGGPTLAAVITLLIYGNKNNLPILFTKIKPRSGIPFLLSVSLLNLVLIYAAISILGVNLLSRYNQALISLGVVGFLLVILKWLFSAIWEEYGWRGFMLHQLSRRTHLLFASLMVSLAWFVWHIPLFFIDGGLQGSNIGLFFITIIFETLIYTYIFVKDRKSIFGVTLYHTFANVSAELVILAGIDLEAVTRVRSYIVIAIGVMLIPLLFKISRR